MTVVILVNKLLMLADSNGTKLRLGNEQDLL